MINNQAGTAMTAEQFDENWLRSRHFFVTGCNKGALVTLDDALAYSAHVREAAQREIEHWESSSEQFEALFVDAKKRTESTERKLAEVEKALADEQEAHEQIAKCLLPLVGTSDGTSVSAAQRAAVEIKYLRAVLASLRAESKEG